MSVLGVELSDAGILVAGGQPAALLEVDGNRVESPGFALAEKQGLTVGAAAERKAHLYPRQILNPWNNPTRLHRITLKSLSSISPTSGRR